MKLVLVGSMQEIRSRHLRHLHQTNKFLPTLLFQVQHYQRSAPGYSQLSQSSSCGICRDQIALALIWKYFLQVSTFISLKTSTLVGGTVSCHRFTIEDPLRLVKPLNKNGYEKRAWYICVNCLQYRPTRKGYCKEKVSGLIGLLGILGEGLE